MISLRISSFLEKYKILDPQQYGFRSKHSILDAVTTLTNDVFRAFEASEATLAVSCDISKAFDIIKHKIFYSLTFISVELGAEHFS